MIERLAVRGLWFWSAALSLALAGCSSSGSSGGNGGSAGVGAGGTTGGGSFLGAWYGSGPDGDQCFVVCANGRLFTADRPCTETTAGDFDTYLGYTASGSTLDIESASSSCWITTSACAHEKMSWSVSGASATVGWCGFTLTMTRTAESSPLCDDAARQPC